MKKLRKSGNWYHKREHGNLLYISFTMFKYHIKKIEIS